MPGLATPEADHDFSLPSWVALLSLAAGLVLILGPPVTVPAALMGSSIGVMTGLLVARSIGVVSRSQSWKPCWSASMSLSSRSW